MFGTGFILLMLGASGITDMHGDLQKVPVCMVAAGLALMLIGQKLKEKGKEAAR